MVAGAIGGNPSIVNFVMFVAVFSMLSLIYLFAVAFNEDLSLFPWLPLAVDGANTFFFVIAGIALAAELGVHSCGDLVSFSMKPFMAVSWKRRGTAG
jgi:hypothetical protein